MDWSDRLKKHTVLSEKATKLVRPFLDAFSFTHFTYFYIKADGSSACLTTGHEWLEKYLNEKLYVQNPFLRHPKYYSTGWYFNQPTSEKVQLMKSSLMMDESCTLLMSNKEISRGFSFGASPRSHAFIKLVNEQQIFYRFIQYFLKDGKKILSSLENNAVDTPSLIGPQFFTSGLNGSLKLANRDRLYKQIGGKDNWKNLSLQEKRMLVLYTQGYSAPMIADTMKLSSRTIETYIDKCKSKLDCFSRKELLEKSRELQDWGLLQ